MSNTAQVSTFPAKLQKYKQTIDADIEAYAKQLERHTLEQFGANSRLEIDAYLQILRRGGKRIRGALTMVGYEMAGGTDTRMILQAARAVEMLHAYILIVDDFQDRSAVRRGGPTAHKLLAQHHRTNELAGDSEHFGASIALNAALSGAHAAQQVLAHLDVDAELRLKTIQIINKAMIITAHGQTSDIINEVVAEVSSDDIERVLEWKTAYYTFFNPLSVGMTLAGADVQTIAGITDYANHAGKAFQITDDIIGTFGSEFESGKSPMDDIREGKRTLIIAYALEHTDNDNKNFLVQMLGNADITPVEFERVKTILINSGALEYAKSAATQHVAAAVKSLRNQTQWSGQGVQFLTDLANYLNDRKV